MKIRIMNEDCFDLIGIHLAFYHTVKDLLENMDISDKVNMYISIDVDSEDLKATEPEAGC